MCEIPFLVLGVLVGMPVVQEPFQAVCKMFLITKLKMSKEQKFWHNCQLLHLL